MKVHQIFKTALLGIVVTGFSIGCNAQAENKNEDANANLAANNGPVKSENVANTAPAAANVYAINNVGTAGGNRMTDFSWTQNGKKVSLSEVAKNKVVFL